MAYYEATRDPSLPPIEESVRRKRRWGCACGCAFFLLALLFGLMGATYWMLRPLPPVAKELLLPPGATGFGVVRLGGDDAGLKDLTRYCLRLVEQQQATAGHDGAGYALKTVQTFIGQLLAGEAALALVPKAGEGAPSINAANFDVLFAFSVKNHLGSLLGRTLLRSAHGPSGSLEPFQGGAVITAPSREPGAAVHLGWLGNLMIASSRLDLIKSTIEQVAASKTTPVDLDLQDLLDQIQFYSPPAGQDFAMAVLLRPGVLKSIVERMLKSSDEKTAAESMKELNDTLAAAGLAMDDVQGLTLTGDIVSADSIRFDLRLVMPRPETARKVLTALNQAWQSAPEPAATPLSGQVVWRREMKTIGSVVSVTLTLSNLRSYIRERTPLGQGLPSAGATTAPAP